MTEKEYIILTNRVKITAAKNHIYDCLDGSDYGISEEEYVELCRILCTIEQRLFDLVDVDTCKTEDKE